MSSLQRPVLISGVFISEERTLGWESGPRSDSTTILMGKVGHETSLLQLSVILLFKRIDESTTLD